MVLLTTVRQTYVDLLPPPAPLSHGMENVSVAPVGQNKGGLVCGDGRSDCRSATWTVAAYFGCQGSPNVGQVKVSQGNKGFIKAPVFIWSAHVQGSPTVFHFQ